jgi:hypothetical protein
MDPFWKKVFLTQVTALTLCCIFGHAGGAETGGLTFALAVAGWTGESVLTYRKRAREQKEEDDGE